jgi:hypothetical protein
MRMWFSYADGLLICSCGFSMQTRGDGESVPSQDDRDSRTQSDAKWRRFRTMEKTELATKLREKPDEEDTANQWDWWQNPYRVYLSNGKPAGGLLLRGCLLSLRLRGCQCLFRGSRRCHLVL